MDEDDYFSLDHQFKQSIVPLLEASRNLANHLCDGCKNTFSCDSIDVCKRTMALKKALEDFI